MAGRKHCRRLLARSAAVLAAGAVLSMGSRAVADPCLRPLPGATALLAPHPEPDRDRASFLHLVRPSVAREAKAALASIAGRIEKHRLNEIVEDEFERFDRFYHIVHWGERRRLNAATIRARHGAARGTWCVEQRINEAEILLQYSARDAQVRDAIARIDAADASGAYASPAQAPDGSWGPCRDAWFARLDDTVDALGVINERPPPRGDPVQPLRFLEEVDSPDKLTALLKGLQVSSIAQTGFYQRPALGSVEAGVGQLVYKESLRALAAAHGAAFLDDPAYCRALTTFLDDMQDPATGYWGPWVETRNGVVKLADLSLTFHAVSYRKGDVNMLQKLAGTTLAIRALPYPYGWTYRDRDNAHNAYDVAKIFHRAWSVMSQDQRDQASEALASLLAWVLSPASIRPDGTVVGDETFYTSPGAALSFTVSFLAEVGYFRDPADPRPAFWTTRDFPEAPATCAALKAGGARLTEDTPQLTDAREALRRLCP
jgi:hypothetical protein